MSPFEHRIAHLNFLFVRKTKTSSKIQKSPNGKQVFKPRTLHSTKYFTTLSLHCLFDNNNKNKVQLSMGIYDEVWIENE